MTCSAARLEANRANSIHSTGPRTEEGKAASSRNALSHGLTATFPVILPGEEPEFESLRDGLYLSIRPEGTLEDLFFSRLVHATWNLRRCDLIEVNIAPDAGDPLASTDDSTKRRAVNVDLYRNRAERTLYRCTKELRLLQSGRSTREIAAARQYPISAVGVDLVPPLADIAEAHDFSKAAPSSLFRNGEIDWAVGERLIAERRERLEAEARAAADQAAEMHENLPQSESEPNEAIEPAAVNSTYRREGPKTGRNEPCPCGSGVKFKRCCGQ